MTESNAEVSGSDIAFRGAVEPARDGGCGIDEDESWTYAVSRESLEGSCFVGVK